MHWVPLAVQGLIDGSQGSIRHATGVHGLPAGSPAAASVAAAAAASSQQALQAQVARHSTSNSRAAEGALLRAIVRVCGALVLQNTSAPARWLRYWSGCSDKTMFLRQMHCKLQAAGQQALLSG